MFCPYCAQQATVDIPSPPGRVCAAHALEFWTGLLAYVKDRSATCENQGTPCTCQACNQLSTVIARPITSAVVEAPPEDAREGSDAPVPVNADSSDAATA